MILRGRTYSGREVLRALRRAGFDEVSRCGSHVKLKNPSGRTVIVPDHLMKNLRLSSPRRNIALTVPLDAMRRIGRLRHWGN